MASLAEIRARLQAADTKNGSSTGGGDQAIYPHWNIEEGASELTVKVQKKEEPTS